MKDLDNPRVFPKYDPGRMVEHLRRFPGECRRAWAKGLGFALPDDFHRIDKVVVLGMGGSAIGADLIKSVYPSVPLFVQRDYDLPPFVDAKTLVAASSYSGDTEEVLSAFSRVLETDAVKVVITTGGKLKDIAEANSVPVFQIDYACPPRAALSWSMFPMLAFLFKLGLVKEPPVHDLFTSLEKFQERLGEAAPTGSNPAKSLGMRLHQRLAVIYGAGFLSGVARRWKAQLNENSKVWAFNESFPELCHNSVAGYRFPEKLAGQVYVVMLRSPVLQPRLLARYVAVSEILGEAGVSFEVVDAEGEGDFVQALNLVYLGDWVSYYLAILGGVDPSSTEAIGCLKDRLRCVDNA